MKTLTSLLLVLSIAKVSYGQDLEPEKTPCKFDIGVDASSFLNLFNENKFSGYPYYLTLRKNFKSSAIRVGFGGRLIITTTSDSIDLKNETTILAYRLGFEWQEKIEKRWQIYYGVDFTYGMNRYFSEGLTSNNSEHWTRSTNIDEFGFGPNLGVKFKINDRIAIGTETNFIVSYLISNSKTDYALSEVYDENTESKSIRTTYYYPQAMFLIVYL